MLAEEVTSAARLRRPQRSRPLRLPRPVRVVLAELLCHMVIVVPAIHLAVIARDVHYGEISLLSILGCIAWIGVILAALLHNSARPTGARWDHLRGLDTNRPVFVTRPQPSPGEIPWHSRGSGTGPSRR